MEMAIEQAYMDAYKELGFEKERAVPILAFDKNGRCCLAMAIGKYQLKEFNFAFGNCLQSLIKNRYLMLRNAELFSYFVTDRYSSRQFL